MKYVIFIIGLIFLVFNTLAGLIISVYLPFNYLMADLSIIITFSMIYWLAGSEHSGATKIGLTVLFAITGFVRMFCMMITPSTWENNILILVAMGILLIELVCMAGVLFVDKK